MDNILQKNIDGTNYEIVEMPATKRSIIALELKRIATGAKEGVKDLDSDIDYAGILTGILDRIEPEKGAFLLRDIIMNGLRFPVMKTTDDYDVFFTENYHHQIDLVTWIMEHNFGKMIEEIKKKLTKTGILSQIFSSLKAETQKKAS